MTQINEILRPRYCKLGAEIGSERTSIKHASKFENYKHRDNAEALSYTKKFNVLRMCMEVR